MNIIITINDRRFKTKLPGKGFYTEMHLGGDCVLRGGNTTLIFPDNLNNKLHITYQGVFFSYSFYNEMKLYNVWQPETDESIYTCDGVSVICE